ncbi:MAG: hypothetical protein HY052_06690 [Proteobacteria bacterium]|nr:hypothetical protein [Pseudomonadota bacterium]
MRCSKSTLLSTLSVLAILTATSASSAAVPSKDFGLLRSQGRWKMGTVDGQEGVAYCAIVNQFDKGTVLAFSHNAEGLSSIAIDFHDSFFKLGTDYEASLLVDDDPARKFSARVSSERSVVIQIGQDAKFYNALNEDGHLKVKIEGLEATFALRKFSSAYVELLDCAGALSQGPKTAAVPVPRVDKQPLASNDGLPHELPLKPGRRVATTGAELADGTAHISSLEADLSSVALQKQELTSRIEAQDMQAKLLREALSAKEQELSATKTVEKENAERLAKAEAERAQAAEKAAKAQAEMAELARRHAQKIAAIQSLALSDDLSPEVLKKISEGGDKAIVKSEPTQAPVSDAGVTAMTEKPAGGGQEQQKQKVAAVQKNSEQLQTQASLQQAVDRKDKEIDQMQAVQKQQEAARADDISRQEHEMAFRVSDLQRERDALRRQVDAVKRSAQDNEMAAQANKSLKESLVAKEAELAAALEQQTQKSAEMAASFSAAQASYQAKLVAAEEERRGVKQRLDIVTEQFEQQKQRVAELELKNSEHQQEQEALKLAVDRKDEEIAWMQTVRKQRDAERAEDFDRQARALALHVSELQKERDDLHSQLEDVKKSAEDSELAAQTTLKNSLAAKEAELAAALEQQTQKSAEMARLLAETQADYQAKLTAVEAERQELKQKLDAAMAENVPLKSIVEKTVKELADSKAHATSLENNLSSAAQQKQELSVRIEAQDKQTKVLQAALSAKEQELSTTKTALSGDSKQLADVQAQLNSLLVDHASVVDKLQVGLNEKTAQYESMKQQYEEQNKTLPATFKMAADLAAKREDAERLQKQLSEVEAQRAAAAENAEKARAEVAALARQQEQNVATAQSERAATDERLKAIAADLLVKQTALERKAAEQARETERLRAQAQKLVEIETSIQNQVKKTPLARADTALPPPQQKMTAVPSLGAKAREADEVAVQSKLDSLADLAPAAGGSPPSSDKEEPVPLSVDESPTGARAFLDQIMSYHRPTGSSAGAAMSGGTHALSIAPVDQMTLEGLLNSSGMAISDFAPVDQADGRVVTRWVSGKMNGMYEGQSASGNFDDAVRKYIDRYRRDCNGNLDAHISSSETSKAGLLTVADIECKMPSNSYATSFLFLQDRDNFSAILHTAYPAEKTAVRDARDALVRTLKKSGENFSVPPGISRQGVSAQSLHLNVLTSTEATPSSYTDSQGTIIIQ